MSRWSKLIVLLALAGFMASLPGCSGCWEDPIAKKQRLAKEAEEKKKQQEEEEAKKKEEEKKEDFSTKKLQVLPTETGSQLNYCKPGHWTVAVQPMVANNFDFRAEISSLASSNNGHPLRLEGLPHALSTSRDAPLPKDQWKDLELLYFPPRVQRNSNAGSRTAWMKNSIKAAATGREVFQRQEGLSEMKSHEYFMLVLADNPDDYGYLKLLHSTQPLVNDSFSTSTMAHYRIDMPKIERAVPLPTNALTWTSIAVIVWDDLDPKALSPDQQLALLDWLHFGGQLIVSGPRSYSTLKASDLNEYLPVTEVEGVNLTQADLKPLSDHWTITSVNQGTKQEERLPIVIPDQAPLLGLQMTPHAQAYSPPGCEGLVLERRIGRGRICFTGFPLDADAIKNWPSFDSFVNAVLLRRPARKYSENTENVNTELKYADSRYLPLREDPRLNTLVRYFSRDIEPLPEPIAEESGGGEATSEGDTVPSANSLSGQSVTMDTQNPFAYDQTEETIAQVENAYNTSKWTQLELADPRFGGWETEPASGVGGWSDFSGTGEAARGILRRAAGISVPKVDFVMRVLAIYLLVLAPLNWLVFRVMGRVELAWIAAPLIAIVGATAVIRMAQLDIGFARSHTDLAVLELHEGYRRAHLTRYSALYTSLGTNYELEFEDSTALALPFSADPNFKPLLGQQIDLVNLQRGRHVKLTNFQVGSNTTGMVHSEQMYDCGGALTYKAADGTVINNTDLTLREAVIVRRSESGGLQVARLGTINPASAKQADFKSLDSQEFHGQFAQLFPTSDDRNAEDTVQLDRLLRLALEKLRLYPNEVRLMAWTDNKLSGLEVQPAASQYLGRSMVLAHLAPAPLPKPLPDENLRIDFKIRNSTDGEGLDVLPVDENSLSGTPN